MFKYWFHIGTILLQKQKPRLEGPGSSKHSTDSLTKKMRNFPYSSQLYRDVQDAHGGSLGPTGSLSMANRLGLPVPNLAPDVDAAPAPPVVNPAPQEVFSPEAAAVNPNEPRKKKYAKEAWPGKKPTHGLLV